MEGSRLRDIVFDCAKPLDLAAFWAAALGYQPLRDDAATDPSDVCIVPFTEGPRVWFCQVPEPKTAKNRVHLDVQLRYGEQIDWLVGLGARVLRPLGAVAGEKWAIMADPEDNEFCAFPAD